MKTLNLGIVLDQGSDFSLVIGISGRCGPIDITGYSFLGEMKSSTDPDAATVAEFQFKILDQGPMQGRVKWFMSAETTLGILTSVSNSLQTKRLATPFVYDIKMKDTAGTVSRIIQGIAYVSPEATQEVF